MYRRYYSYSDMPQLIRHEEAPPKEVHTEKKKEAQCVKPPETETGKLLGRFEIDDVILGVVILALLLDDGDDGLLLAALAFIFLTGIL